MIEFINLLLSTVDNDNKNIDKIIDVLMERFNDATDEEKREILSLISQSQNFELFNHPKLEEIRNWAMQQNQNN